MSYCRFGPDSDVYVYPSTWYIDNTPCWGLMTTPDQYPETLFSRQVIYDRLIALRNEGRRVPDAALERLRQEMKTEADNKVVVAPTWQNAWPLISTRWSECGVGFRCACGQGDVIIDDESGERTCGQCGRVYRCSMQLEVRSPDVGREGLRNE